MFKPALFVSVLGLTLSLAQPALGHSGHDHDQDPVASSEQSNERQARVRQSPGKGKAPHATISAYKDDEVLGWKMLVHEDLMADKDLYQEVKDEMHHQLFRITKVVPAEQVAILQKVPVWIELNNTYSNNCQFHPSKKWLEGNGYLPEKAQAIEISNAKGLARTLDRLRDFWHGLRRWRLDPLSDHNMGEYITAIRRAVEQERVGLLPSIVPSPHLRESQKSACNRHTTG